jgi:hypothetical protein
MGTKKSRVEQRIDPGLWYAGRESLGRSTELFNRPEQLPSQYVPMDPYRQAGLQSQAYTAATGGAGVAPATSQQFAATQRGEFLFGNPYLDYNVQRAVGATTPYVQSGFAQGGRFGSGAMAQAQMDVGQRTAANLYGQNYQMERDRMTQSLAYAPTAEAMQYADAQRLKDVGSEYEADVGAQQAEATRQYMWPYQQVALYNQAMTGNPLMGATKTMSRTPFDWGGAALSLVGSLASPSMPGAKA